MKLPGWVFGAITGVLAVVLSVLIESTFVHPLPYVLHNLPIKAAIMVSAFTVIFHFLFRRQRVH